MIGVNAAEADRRLRTVLALAGDNRAPPQALAERPQWLVGTVDEVAARIEEYRAAGVTRVFLQHLDHRDLDVVALIGDELVPLVAGPAAG